MVDASTAPESSEPETALGKPMTPATPVTEENDRTASTEATESARVQLGEKLAENKWVYRAARLGYAAMGLLYVIAGLTMALAAANLRDPVRGIKGSLDVVMGFPLGRVAVGLIAIGLFGYIFRRVLQLIIPPTGDPPRTPVARLGRRMSYVWSGLVNVGIALTALQLFLWSTAYGAFVFTSNFALTPHDGWFLVIVGLGIIGYAGWEFYMAARRRFKIDLLLDRMTRRIGSFVLWCGIVGYAGRGIAFLSLGLLFVYTGWNIDDIRLGHVIETVQTLPYTIVVLIIAAIGLTSYGLYLLFAAWYLRLIATW